jgi:Flp pilus assembly protein TadG
MSRRFVLVAALLGLAACDQPTAPTSALSSDLRLASASGTKMNEWLDISGTAFNECVPEDVFLSGRVHIVLTESLSGSTLTAKIHENFNDLKGVGLTSGDTYHLNLAVKADETLTVDPPFPFVEDISETAILVSNGPGDNLKIHIIETVTYDGTDFTFVVKKFVIDCRG